MNKKTKRLFAIYCALVLVFAFAVPALADGDPLQVINNLSTFIFSLIRAIGQSSWASVLCRSVCPSKATTQVKGQTDFSHWQAA